MVDSYIAHIQSNKMLVALFYIGLTELYMYNKQKTYYDYQPMQRKTKQRKRKKNIAVVDLRGRFKVRFQFI